jgi:NAD(P)-dependent dehydrogenase (short-subunit alcohol dehydrogenase family)
MQDMSGKNVIVTGGNTGLGYKTCLELAAKGARVTIACRSQENGRAAAVKIAKALSGQTVDTIPLDLLDLESIRSFADKYGSICDRLDIIVNNAGVVNLEKHSKVWSGHEAHMATNHYGHFALVGHLWPLLCATPDSRIVIVSSLAYRQGVINLDDLTWDQRPYDRIKCYGDSKLANLLFMGSINRLAGKKGKSLIAVAAHPGLTATERQQTIGIGGKFSNWIASPVEKGVRPQLMASSCIKVSAGDFFGPRYGLFGPPKPLKLHRNALDHRLADKLWKVSEEATGVTYV